MDSFFKSLCTHQDKLRFVQARHEEAAASPYAATLKLYIDGKIEQF